MPLDDIVPHVLVDLGVGTRSTEGRQGMIHRAVATMFATLAISLAILGWAGYWLPVYGGFSVAGRDYVYVYFGEGLARLYLLRADEAIYVDSTDSFITYVVHRAADDARCQRISHARPGLIRPYALVASRMRPSEGALGTPTIHLYGVRTWIWAPIALLAVYPVMTLVLDRFASRRLKRRVQRGFCITCGYDLTGNTSGICPECGTTLSAIPNPPGGPEVRGWPAG